MPTKAKQGDSMNRIAHNRTHGLSDTPPYQRWLAMRNRCNNPNNPAYKNYGGRGIKVCDRWQNSFSAYYEDVGDTPSDGMSLDRIDNNGHYEPTNVRWADAKTQGINRRIFSKSEYRGVNKRSTGKYRARIMHDGQSISIGDFDTKEEAAYMYDCFALSLWSFDCSTNFVYI